MRKFISILFVLFFGFKCIAQNKNIDPQQDYWKITNRKSIVWDLTKEERIPHKENIEMAGQNVAAILYYEIDEKKNFPSPEMSFFHN